MKKILIFFIIIFVSKFQIFAQVETNYFPEKNALESLNLPKQGLLKPSKVIKLPEIDNKQMLAEEASSDKIGPYHFGKGVDYNIQIKNSEWQEIPGGRLWSAKVSSPGAVSLNFILKDVALGKDSELYISNEEGTILYGPVREQNIPKSGRFMTDIIPGDNAIFTVYEYNESIGQSNLEIVKIVHGYKSVSSMAWGNLGGSESCNNNINCFPAFDQESDAVALVLLANGEELCSGSLLMSQDQSFRPYFLSAFHCVDSNLNGGIDNAEENDAENWLFKFQYKMTSCGGNSATLGVTYNGADLRAAWQPTDFVLMELSDSPIGNPELSWLGWNRTGTTPTNGVSIHHPSGDVMKISIDNHAFFTSNWGGLNNHWLLNFDDGVVEHGSSGSPLLDQNNRVVGQLHGNQNYTSALPYCSQPRAEYGRFNVSWNGGGTAATRLRNWLDPCNTGVTTTNTNRSPVITGAERLCTSGDTYTLTNLPGGASIVWSTSSNISLNSPQGANPANFAHNGTGSSGWIEASVTLPNGCGNNIIIRRDIPVGVPTLYLSAMGTGPYGQVDATVSGGTPPFTFTKNGNTLMTTTQRSVTLPFGCDGGHLGLIVLMNAA